MIDPLKTFIRRNCFFLLSFAVHTFAFVVLLISNEPQKTPDANLDIEVVESVRGGFVQNSSEYKPQKRLRVESEAVPQNFKNSSVQDSETHSLNDTRNQQISNQDEMMEGFSDISKDGNSHQNYLDRIRSKIEFYKTYPKASRVLKETGLVKVKLKITKNGHVQKIEIIESSQFKRLDDAAIKAVADASPFEEFPSNISHNSWSIIVPMQFELN